MDETVVSLTSSKKCEENDTNAPNIDGFSLVRHLDSKLLERFSDMFLYKSV